MKENQSKSLDRTNENQTGHQLWPSLCDLGDNSTPCIAAQQRTFPPQPQFDRRQVAFISNPQLDYIVKEVTKTDHHKHPTTFAPVRLGGAGPNGARVAVAEGISPTIIGVQGEELIDLVQSQLCRMGARSFLFGRSGSAGITFGIPNGDPGELDLYVQRPAPPVRLAELVGVPAQVIREASAAFVGPVAMPDAEAIEVHEFVADLAGFSVLQPHPDLIRSEVFGEVAKKFDFVALNTSEARILDPSADGVEQVALRLRWLLGEDVEFAVTNGAERGLLWAEGHWWPIDPPCVRVVNDAGAGDVFATSFVIGKVLKGRSTALALQEALELAARWISAQPLTSLT